MSAGSRSLDELRGPEWRRLLAAARRRLERDGWSLDGTIGLTAPDEAERRAVIGVTGRYRPETAKRLTVGLADLDAALHTAYGRGLVAVLALLDGPLRDRPAERRTESGQRDELRAALARSRHAAEPWYAAWAESVDTDGTLTRLLRRGDGQLLGWAVAVLERLPSSELLPSEGRLPSRELLPLPVLAERATGDTKALIPGSPLAALVLRALALRAETEPPRDRVGQRLLWERFGAVADDLASQVLVLNVRAREDHVVAGWLDDAAGFGIPFRLTLQQLTFDPLTPTARDLYVCENPAVLRAAAAELEEDCAALVCTEGVPSAACRRLLDAAVRAGARLHVRADFDWAGLRIAGSLLDAPRSTHWRMSAADYRSALAEGAGAPLVGAPAASPWDPFLAEELAAQDSAVMEERLLPLLLADLTGPGREGEWMTRTPEAFSRSTVEREGEGGAAWLAELPVIVEGLLGRWECVPDGEVMHGGVGLIVPVRRRAGGTAVLKVSFPHPGNAHEPDAFAAWGGRGAVLLLERDDERFAMLLERVQASTLAEVDDEDEVATVAGRINRRLAVHAPPNLPRLHERAAAWEEQLRKDAAELTHPLSRYAVDAAVATVRELGHIESDTLVHGDLHARNILRADREPWLAVDPKGYAGDPAYDGGTLLKSRALRLLEADDLRTAVRRTLDVFVEAAELDRECARRWAQFHAVQAAFGARRHGFRIARSGPRLDRLTEFVDRLATLLTERA